MTTVTTVLAAGLLLCFCACMSLWRELLEARETLRRERREREKRDERNTDKWRETI